MLGAERSLFNPELSQAQTKRVLFQASINLYKAMGGGWVTEADRMKGVMIGSNVSTPFARGTTFFMRL